jgi:hemoglobin
MFTAFIVQRTISYGRGKAEKGYPAPAAGTNAAPYDGRDPSMDDQDIYAVIGEDGFHRLIAAFYRQVPGDDILGPMYPAGDLAGAEERLRDFLIFRFGGPQRYIEQRGHPRLRMRHFPFAISQAARDRWIQLMTNALNEAALPPDVDSMLRQFFDGVATFMINRE